MKKRLIVMAAIALALFAVPYGRDMVEVSAAASDNNSMAALGALLDIPTSTNADTIAENVKEVTNELGKDNMKTALAESDSIVNRYAALEDAYREKMNWGTSNASRIQKSSDLPEEVKSLQTLSVIGASFSGAKTTSVEPVKEVPTIATSAYEVTSDPIFLDINILDENDKKIEKELDIPVVITISVPKGIDGSKAVIFHFVDGTMEAIKPEYDGFTLRFAVSHFSTFAIAEANTSTSEDNAFERYREKVANEIANAKDGATVKISRDKNINALPNDIMKALYKKQTVALELEYTYEGKEYTVTIPAGKAEDNAIEWYGPLYLQLRYGK